MFNKFIKKNKKKIILLSSSLIISSIIIIPSLLIASSNNKNNKLLSWNGNENISRSIEEIKNEYIQKYDASNIKISNYKANIKISNDSYEQSNKLSHTIPNSTLSFKYEKAAKLSKYTFSKIKTIKDFVNTLNDSNNNEWQYNVSEWSATANRRFTGVCIIVPMYAPKVTINHDEKIYDDYKFSILKEEREFLKDLYFKKIRGAIEDFYINGLKLSEQITNQKLNLLDYAARLLTSDNDSEVRRKLKPLLKSENLKSETINEVSFGNFKIKYITPNKLIFKSNNLVPISDMKYKEKCEGPTCSHNLRHLIDVVLTSVKDLIFANFGKADVTKVFTTWLISFFIENFIDKDLGRTVAWFFRLNYGHGSWLNDISWYINKNIPRIMLQHFGKVEKHGIQLGKHGTLVSGVTINSEDNLVEVMNSSEEPLIIFEGNDKKIFNESFTEYDYNTIHCIKEMSNYKKLYVFLNKQNIDKTVLEKLLNNIKNVSIPSNEIYKMYLNYIQNNIMPIEYNVSPKSFQNFINDGWKIPKDVYTWDLLDSYIIPTILNNNIFIKDNNRKIYLYKNNEFINNTYKINKNIDDKIYFDRESKEIFRFEDYNEID